MKLKCKDKKILFGGLTALVIAVAVVVGLMFTKTQTFAATAETQVESVVLESKLYEFTDDNSSSSYGFSSTKQVSKYSNGSTFLGGLSVKGASLTKSTYNGVQAIGVNSGTSLTFTYNQNITSKNYNGKTWYLSSDVATNIACQTVGAIGNGGIIVLQSSDGETWNPTGAKMVSINGKSFTFTPNGSDIQNGKYYKFLSVAEIYYSYVSGSHKEYPSGWCKFWGCHGYWVDDYSNVYKNLGQEATVYVCANNPSAISFASKATDEFKIENDELTYEEISFLQKGTTLVDGGVSFSSITVDNLKNNCYSIYYSYNDGELVKLTSAKQTFSLPGKYSFSVRTPLGEKKETTIYLVNPNKDLAYSQYFGEGLIDSSKRIYDMTKAVPVYMVGKKISITPQSKFLPGIYGKVYYYKNDNALKENSYSVEYELSGLTEAYTAILQKEGYYIFDLYSSDPTVNSGEIVNYSFRLYIKDDQSYAPTVNYELITSMNRNSSFVRKVYAVTLKTAGGGSFVYCFPYSSEYYDLAYEVAENIELLYVENYVGYYYYKSLNSNTKTKYTSKTKLFETIDFFAKENVCTLYLEANTDYLTRAANEEALKDLTKQSINRDTCVVTSETVKKALQSTEIYANDYKFVQVADYESDIVMALDESGNQYRISYGTTLGDLFTTTQTVTITEENWFGRNTYKVIYYAENENKGELTLKISGKDTTVKCSEKSTVNLIGNKVSIVASGDPYDSQSMVIISNIKGDRKVMLLNEAEDYSFANDNMEYEITIVNRFGTSYSFNLTVREVKEEIDSKSEENSSDRISKNADKVLNATGNIESVGLNNAYESKEINIDKSYDNANIKTEEANSNTIGNYEGLSAGAIAGISIGSVGGLVLVGLVVFLIVRKRIK